jgi:hypothetical protein
MTEKTKSARPSQVTMAGWVALVGSALLVVTLFDAVARLRTVEFRDTIEEFLSTPPGSGLGLDLPQVLEILRGLMFFSGAMAAAAVVLAIYVLQRNNAARVGYTIAAVAIMLTAPVSGGFLPVMIAFAAIMLWTKPARDWFAGVPVSQAGSAAPGSTGPFAAHHPRPRVEGHLLSSENQPPDERPEGAAPESGGPANDETAPWPRMPGDTTDRPLPPPTQGFGTPQAQGGPGAPQAQGGPADQQQPGPPQQGQPQQGQPQGQPQQGQQWHPAYPEPGYPPQAPPYGEQLPYGQPPYGQPYGQQVPYGGYPPQYGQLPYGQLPPGQPTQNQPPYGKPYFGAPQLTDQRPVTVTIAAWVTWVFAGLTILGFVLTAFAMVAAPDDMVRTMEQDPSMRDLNVTTDQIVAALWVVGAIALFWAVAAMVLAWFAYRRANWARITLVVSAGITALFSLLSLAVTAAPILLMQALSSGAVIVLLFVGGANDWYARRAGAQGFPGPFQPYGQQPQQPQQPPQQYGGQQPPQYGGQQGQPGRPEEPKRDRGKDEPPSNVW